MNHKQSAKSIISQPILPDECLKSLSPPEGKADLRGQRISSLAVECARLAIESDRSRPQIEVYDRLRESHVLFDLQAMTTFLDPFVRNAQQVQDYLVVRGVLRENPTSEGLIVAGKYRRMFAIQMIEVEALGGLYSRRLVANLHGLEWLGKELGMLVCQKEQAGKGSVDGDQTNSPVASASKSWHRLPCR